MNEIHRCQPLLGTFVEVTLRGNQTEERLLTISQEVFAAISNIQQKMSFHDVNSELSKMNATAHQYDFKLTSDMERVLLQALELSQKTGGLFDVCVAPKLVQRGLLPDNQLATDVDSCWQDIVLTQEGIRFNKKLQIDLGGIAKGYAIDAGIAVLPGEVSAIINAGGDIRMTNWETETIHIRALESEGQLFYETQMCKPAAATSAAYFQEDGIAAIMHPKQREQAPPFSVTVFADSAMLADALTKLVYLQVDCKDVLQYFSAEALYITHDGEQHWITH